MPPARTLSPQELGKIRWKGHAVFECLGYTFSVRWNRAALGKVVDRVLGTFRLQEVPEVPNQPAPGTVHEYTLIDLGPAHEPVEERFKLLSGSSVKSQSRDADGILNVLFAHVNTEAFRSTDALLLIHAGAVATPSGDGVILPGNPGSGKSTLVTALVEGGFGYLSDEVAAFDPSTRQLLPYPKTLVLKEKSFELFPALRANARGDSFIRSQWFLHPDDIRPDALAGPCAVGFVIFAQYTEGAPTELLPVSRSAAIQELMTAAFNLSAYGGRALQLLADVVGSAETYRLVSGSLGDAVRAVTSLTSGIGEHRKGPRSRPERSFPTGP